MSVSVKALIFVLSLWVSMQAICNWFDGRADILTASNTDIMAKAGITQTTTSTETTGESSSFLQWGSDAIEAIKEIVFFDYSFWYTTYNGYTEATCESADGRWDGTNSLCQFPNSWHAVWYWIFRPIGLAFLIAFVAIGAGILHGR